MSLEQFYKSVEGLGKGDNLPPVENWNPPCSGTMDLHITRTGDWLHQGESIQRTSLVRLFSKILKREGEQYFLVTPVEKWLISVDAAPFFINAMSVSKSAGEQVITFQTSTDNLVNVDADHPLWVEYDEHDNPLPFAVIRDNLHAVVSRNVFSELASIAEQVKSEHGTIWQVFSSGSAFFTRRVA